MVWAKGCSAWFARSWRGGRIGAGLCLWGQELNERDGWDPLDFLKAPLFQFQMQLRNRETGDRRRVLN